MASVNVSCVPRNPDLLWLQAPDEHRSYNISHDRNMTVPGCRKGDGGLAEVMQAGVPEEVLVHVRSAGFFQLFLAGICQLDHSLINALVERWHPETNTFHLPVGEATVTLQDVQVIWGLPIQGPAVIGVWVTETQDENYWNNLCQEYMGFIPLEDRDNMSKGLINFNTLALSINFSNLDEENEQECICMARRIILALIGSELFLDANTKDVSLNLLRNLVDLSKEGRKSWGSATLCCLYRNLSKATKPDKMGIYGPLLLLQSWAWERFPRIAPQVTPFKEEINSPYAYETVLANKWLGEHSSFHTPTHCLSSYRSFFNALSNDQFKWTPYKDFMNLFPPSCKTGRTIWKYMGPSVFWDEVEVHLSNRVAKQFV